MAPATPRPCPPRAAQAGLHLDGMARLLFDGSRIATALVDAESGCILEANPACRDFFGRADADLAGARLDDLLAPEDRAALGGRGVMGAVAGRPVELRFSRRSGPAAWGAVTVEAFPSGNGDRPIALVQIEDVSGRRRADERRRLAEFRFRNLAEHIPAIVCVHPLDAEAPAIYVSARIEQVTGYRLDELPQRRAFLRGLLHPDDVETVRAMDEASDRTQEPISLRYRIRHRDGRWVWLHELSEVVRDAEGTPRYWQGLLLDVTAEVDAEQALAESEARFRALVQRSTDGFFISDRDGGIVWTSPALRTILGRELPLPCREERFDLVHPDDRAALDRLRGEVRSGPDATGEVEIRVRHADGTWRWVALRATNHLGNPAVRGIVYNVREITGRKRTEQDLAAALAAQRDAVARLEAMDRQRSEVLAMLAHDFRTPLTSIQGYAEMVATVAAADGEMAEFAGIISESAQRLNRMVDDLLAVESLEGRFGTPRLAPARIDEVVTAAVAGLRGAWPGREIRLDLPPGLPPVAIDRDQVTKAVTNLVGNALTYSHDGDPVQVRVEAADGAVEIAVEDGGFGIAPEQLETVFDKYARIRSRDTDGISGSGLGLPIVRAVARAHGGEAWAESEPGVGSTFHLRLPVAGPAIE